MPELRDFVLYLRLTKGRAGIGRQRRDCQRYADKHGIRIVGEFQDADSTAFTKVGAARAARDDYDRMLAMLRADDRKEPLGVLAWHADRLDRDVAHSDQLVQVCAAGRHVVETARSGTYEMWTATGRKRFRADVIDAQFEVDHMTERWELQKAEAAEAGEWLGGHRPFGYEADGVTPREAEADAVDAGSLAILAGLSLSHVRREWNAAGLRSTVAGAEFTEPQVRRILLRARNAGIMVHRGREVGRAVWPPILCRDLAGGDQEAWRAAAVERFRAVQAVLTDPERRTATSTETAWLGSHIYLCPCGAVMRPNPRGRGRRPMYRCCAVAARPAAKDGRLHVIRDAGALDDYVSAAIVARLSREDAAAVFVPARRKDGTADLQARSAGLEARIAEAGDMWEAGEIDRAELVRRRTRMRAELARVRAQIVEAVATSPVEELITSGDVAGTWESWPIERRRAVLRKVLRVTVLPAPPGRPKGWRPGTPYFSSDHVDLEWVPAAEE